jgi:hypothetical protein
MAVAKCEHCRPGDVLVDDTIKHRHRWEAVGGVFIEHRTARASLQQLARIFPGIMTGVAPS